MDELKSLWDCIAARPDPGCAAETSISAILFLKGHPSPEWLAGVGSKLNVDPTVFQRHLDIPSLARRECFPSPSLPSAADGIVQLQFITIGARWKDEGWSQNQIDGLREQSSGLMEDYLRKMRSSNVNEVKLGDSVVRSYCAHDEKYFSIEQHVSVAVQRAGSKWTSERYPHHFRAKSD